MPSVADYEKNLQQVLIDAAAEPSISQFIDPNDLELITVDNADGSQSQVQALSRGAVRRVVERILAQGRQVDIDIKHWICSPDEFNLCAKLDTPVGKLMRDLDSFLKSKLTQGGLHATGLVMLFSPFPAVGVALTIFGALGFVNNVFVELCDCPVSA
jgi:hypothetical protein